MEVLLNAAIIILPLLLSAAARNRLSAGNMKGSGVRDMRIISQYSHSASMSGTPGTWYAASSAASLNFSFRVLDRCLA